MFISFYPKNVFPTVCLFLKEPFHHAGWELTVEDYDEEIEELLITLLYHLVNNFHYLTIIQHS